MLKALSISLVLLALPLLAQGYVLSDFVDFNSQATKVENQVDFQVSTGGNSVSPGGSINQGTAEVKVDVETKINDQAVEPINIEVEQEGEVEVKVEQNIEADEQQANVEQTIETNGQVEKKDYQVDLNQPTNETLSQNLESQAVKIQTTEEPKVQEESKTKNIVRKFSNWWSILLENLRLTIANIFNLF